jgi:hypothetical protein
MLSGFNTNVRHRGLLLHVQTEDSGRLHPHIITHLYHGGTILASDKSEYGDRLDSDDLVAQVRGLMEAQHKAMLRRLTRGELDASLKERLGRELFVETDDGDGDTESGAAGSTAPTLAGVDDAGGADPVAAAVSSAVAAIEPPLDEVVLEYLVERSRKRRRRTS